ncbi:hypothetical protein [Thermofilum pendens]|uniref:Restriction endonuclease type IV Mrr domain-containing protein n=1 Tax=Thermofilum pendens (strain DSM 2475 / Hrk 5) TaxID=368408 RepID=A1RYW3_THEPD|nr:hypothetical protein [Thermofilum pendens]ABL78393.1 conserved hypothetical protein [Thermofilum pendens Hrk 5]
MSRETLHDFTVEYVKILAEVFGWSVKASPGQARGPDVVIEHSSGGKVDAVMFVEIEVGHDTGGAARYFGALCSRLEGLVEEYRSRYGDVAFTVVVVTNAPRRLSNGLRKEATRREFERRLGFEPVEGRNVFIVPVLLAREVLPAIFVKALGTREK